MGQQKIICAHCKKGGDLNPYGAYWDATVTRWFHEECNKEGRQKEAYECQKIDCNCNDCGYMERDFDTYNNWKEANREMALDNFNHAKAKAIEDALAIEDERGRQGALREANRMKFQFTPSTTNYGKCLKFDKPVSFIPVVCQLETQDCFIHRKGIKY